MNISSSFHNVSARYFEFPYDDGPADAASQGLGDLETEHDPLGGMANDSPLDKLNDARNGSISAPGGLGTASRELGEGSTLGAISEAFGRDILGEAEALAGGDTGLSLPGIRGQDRLGQAVSRAAGSTASGWGVAGAAVGGVVGGLFGGPAGVGAGMEVGHIAGDLLGIVLDSGVTPQDSSPSNGAEGSGGGPQGTGGNSGAGETSTDEAGAKGMGDNQEGDTKGDPMINSLELQRRAGRGDGKAATVLGARNGAQALVPGWTKNSDAREGQGKHNNDGDAVLKGAGRVQQTIERDDDVAPSGARPNHAFAASLAARAMNPVVQPR